MKTVSLKIEDSIFEETEKILSRVKNSRNNYINEAIAYYNRHQNQFIPELKRKNKSELTSTGSLTAIKDFERDDYVD